MFCGEDLRLNTFCARWGALSNDNNIKGLYVRYSNAPKGRTKSIRNSKRGRYIFHFSHTSCDQYEGRLGKACSDTPTLRSSRTWELCNAGLGNGASPKQRILPALQDLSITSGPMYGEQDQAVIVNGDCEESEEITFPKIARFLS